MAGKILGWSCCTRRWGSNNHSSWSWNLSLIRCTLLCTTTARQIHLWLARWDLHRLPFRYNRVFNWIRNLISIISSWCRTRLQGWVRMQCQCRSRSSCEAAIRHHSLENHGGQSVVGLTLGFDLEIYSRDRLGAVEVEVRLGVSESLTRIRSDIIRQVILSHII